MIHALLPAIQDRKAWLARFTRRDYSRAFEEYRNRFSPPYRRALREAGEASGPLAEGLLDALAEGWRRERFWNRTSRRFEEKQMIIVYLSPMLLESGEEDFANCLRDAWNRRWPKDAYQIAPYQKLRRSFRNVILGFDLGRRDDEEDD